MSPPTITGIHLVGSIPLPTTKEVFTTITRALPNGLLTRIPDGEVGERCNFITWQGRILAKKDFLLRETFRKGLKLDPVHLELSAEEVEDGKKELEAWEMETEWDRFALASWEVSKESKEEGVVGEEVRFLVCLPSAVTMTSLCVREEFQEIFERVYERALVGVVERLGSVIPRGDDVWKSGRGVPWFDEKERYMVDALARLCDAVGEGVECGVHLCYGDTVLMVGLAEGVLEKVKRRVDYVHVPVPKDRDDGAYFEPLKGLQRYVDDGVELSFGLVHADDLEGTKRRIRAAGKFVSTFSVSTECGLGRLSRERMQTVLEIFAVVATPRPRM
ncbi:hypothetical protein CLAFUW4_02893 [Fulvia fulva]|uniref:Uncharacterized protein n=1 Tax=Passalora fulva TaxID=5499 RepID=A0A9Q8P5T9_PASFU|nr:uncharacterized protein CLAFUR5_02881 [Fulvia fulva]KAK4631726.1 hypothetical protein CLAFUR4_02886 [Fulvia fulva]KAK4633137.1 hypothetical protein CLAFUR0_02889 [Fulvia fulva]UJO14460.1 hypothetical protein CLAFUR5_02881 [Fulvia fulva]WPV11485.1 hypothetical protein CLAFUW4_02893 [Fulvia fulva]WPV26899.1 hypothetical protein CLAFUW7_02890 [Fulvia fulva]